MNRGLETADRIPVTALGRDSDAEVVGDRGIVRNDRQSRPTGALGFHRPARFKMGHGVGGELTKFVRCLFRTVCSGAVILSIGCTQIGKNFDFGTRPA